MSWKQLYNRMRNVAASYSNYCEDNASTRRCEKEMDQIEKEARELADSEKEEFECCGNLVVGGEYMDDKEMICCGNPLPKD